MAKKESGHLSKSAGETYLDPTKFTEFGPEPKDTEDLDDAKAARYAADCSLREHYSNIGHRNSTDAKNIKQIQGAR
jgi:hypothetical protein